MAVTEKKFGRKKTKARVKPSSRLRKQAIAKPAARFDPIADAEECKKISQTLDVEAFDAFHEKNTASQRYWESKE